MTTNHTTDDRPDIREVVGANTPGAAIVIGIYSSAMFAVVATTTGVASNVWGPLLCAVIASLAAALVLWVSGDPLPRWTTILLTLAGPAACALGLAATPGSAIASILFQWATGASIPIYCLMIVRGRYFAPWIALLLNAVVRAVWATANGQPVIPTLLTSLTDIAPLVMAIFFALVVRPTATGVFTLRARAAARIAEISAATAAADERAQQLRDLDRVARAPLTRIAEGHQLSATERIEYGLLEAHLRDRLRAPMLSDLRLDQPVYEARVRGVEVVLLDDHTSAGTHDEGLPEVVAAAFTKVAAGVFETADNGQVVIRIAPPDRIIRCTVLHRSADGRSVRYEVDRVGRVQTDG